MQTMQVYTNVTHGEIAKKVDLQNTFDNMELEDIIKIILEKGEMQISPLERELMYETMFKDIVTHVVNMCINPDTQRPYPHSVIERALKDSHFAVQVSKATKKQALEVIKRLRKTIPIERAQMRLKCVMHDDVRKLKTLLKNGEATIEKEEYNTNDKITTLIILIDPGLFRDVDDLVTTSTDGEVEVLNTTVQQEGEESIDDIDVSASVTKREVSSEEEDVEKKPKQKKKKAKKVKQVGEEEDKGNEEKPSKKKKGKKGAQDVEEPPKKTKHEDGEEEDTKPNIKSKRSKKSKKVIESEEEKSQEEEEEEEPNIKKKKSKKAVVETEIPVDNEEEPIVETLSRKAKRDKKKVHFEEEEEEEEPITKIVKDEDEDDQEEEEMQPQIAPKKNKKKNKK
jgi:ribosome maturation protein SDO1